MLSTEEVVGLRVAYLHLSRPGVQLKKTFQISNSWFSNDGLTVTFSAVPLPDLASHVTESGSLQSQRVGPVTSHDRLLQSRRVCAEKGTILVTYGRPHLRRSKHWWLGLYIQDLTVWIGSDKVCKYRDLGDIMTTLIYTIETARVWSVLKVLQTCSFNNHASDWYFKSKPTCSKRFTYLPLPWSNVIKAFCPFSSTTKKRLRITIIKRFPQRKYRIQNRNTFVYSL